ncbi:cohesin subunit SA-1 [Fopius arisanus]|uniref:Cohesin subunit SA-1 n=1 Tax=Fopius arisanus TaxID=64838 RepID=A0A9R1T8E8_9HYME|nr:PREDICTED: cohesin subunit SA-1-like [Fopius arisanus]
MTRRSKRPHSSGAELERMEVDDASLPIDAETKKTSSETMSLESARDPSESSPSSASSPESRRSLRARPSPQDSPTPESSSSNETEPSSLPPGPKSKSSRRRLSPMLPSLPQNKDCLFNVLKESDIDLPAIAFQWIELYKTDPVSATVELFELFIHASGSSFSITPQILNEFTEATQKRIEELYDHRKDFPLKMYTITWKTFASNFIEFLRVLFLQCQNSIIYDGNLLNALTLPLTSFSSSPVRALRYTSTLILLNLVTVLNEIDSNVKSTEANNNRQLKSETEKIPSERSIGRIESLQAKKNELQENRTILIHSIVAIMNNVFGPRTTDTLVEIRLLCLEELGVWLEKYPLKHASNLKFIGYGLSDPSPEFKVKCLKILQSIYESEDLNDRLDDFNRKFKDRIVAICLDKDTEVAVEGVKLMGIIYQNYRTLLSNDDHEIMYQLVYCKHRNVAKVSGEFVIAVCSADDSNDSEEDQTDGSLLINLVAFFTESDLPDHAPYLVDALIDDNECLQNWKSMTKLLLHDDLNEDSIISLVKIMVASVQQSATGMVPPGRVRKKRLTAGDQQKILSDKQKLSEHFIQSLPQLLVKFRNNREVISKLLVVPQYFDLQMYVTSHQESKLPELFNEINVIIEETTDINTLRAISKTLEYFTSELHPKLSQCITVRDNILSTIIEQYKKTMNDCIEAISHGETLREDITKNVVEWMMKVAVFVSCHDMRNFDMFEFAFGIFNWSKNFLYDLGDGFCHAMHTVYYLFLWGRNHLDSEEALGAGGEQEAVQFKKKLDAFIKDTTNFLEVDSGASLEIRTEAFKCVCDILVVFRTGLQNNPNPLLHKIIYQPDGTMFDILNVFVQKNVFVQDNSDDEYRSRRNILMTFCKLFMCDVFPIAWSCVVLKHYNDFYNDYGDIIKMTLMKAKARNKMNWMRMITMTLITVYENSNIESNTIDPDDFCRLIALAKRFMAHLGIDTTRNKEQVMQIHLSGINYVTAVPDNEVPNTDVPPRIGYLEVLAEFSVKLSKEGKDEVLKALDEILPSERATRNQEWQPLLKYRKSLTGRRRNQFDSRGGQGEKSNVPVEQRKKKTPRKPSAQEKKESSKRPTVQKKKTKKATHAAETEAEDSLDFIRKIAKAREGRKRLEVLKDSAVHEEPIE